jgi:hypothetical protein
MVRTDHATSVYRRPVLRRLSPVQRIGLAGADRPARSCSDRADSDRRASPLGRRWRVAGARVSLGLARSRLPPGFLQRHQPTGLRLCRRLGGGFFALPLARGRTEPAALPNRRQRTLPHRCPSRDVRPRHLPALVDPQREPLPGAADLRTALPDDDLHDRRARVRRAALPAGAARDSDAVVARRQPGGVLARGATGPRAAGRGCRSSVLDRARSSTPSGWLVVACGVGRCLRAGLLELGYAPGSGSANGLADDERGSPR